MLWMTVPRRTTRSASFSPATPSQSLTGFVEWRWSPEPTSLVTTTWSAPRSTTGAVINARGVASDPLQASRGLESETDRGPYTEVRREHQKSRAQGRDNVASVNDPMKAWQDMIEQFQKAAFGSHAPDLWQMMFAPMQQQLDLIQKALEAQAEFHRELTEQAFAPMRQVFEGLKQAANTTRAAGEALKEAGNLLTQQATAMDQALSFSGPFFDVTAPMSEGSTKGEER